MQHLHTHKLCKHSAAINDSLYITNIDVDIHYLKKKKVGKHSFLLLLQDMNWQYLCKWTFILILYFLRHLPFLKIKSWLNQLYIRLFWETVRNLSIFRAYLSLSCLLCIFFFFWVCNHDTKAWNRIWNVKLYLSWNVIEKLFLFKQLFVRKKKYVLMHKWSHTAAVRKSNECIKVTTVKWSCCTYIL